MKKFELVNEELKQQVLDQYQKLMDLIELGSFYTNKFKEECNLTDIKTRISTDIVQQKVTLEGFGAFDQSGAPIEIFNDDIRTFARGKPYQPLKKTKFNKEKTNDFVDCVVDLKPMYELLKGDNDHLDFSNHTVRYRSFRPEVKGDKVFITIEDQDVNEYVLLNYKEDTEFLSHLKMTS